MPAAPLAPQRLRQRRPTLQAAHIEVALLSLSGLRLCAALAFSKPGGGLLDALLLLVTHIASLLLEFHPASRIASRYVLRRSASHGVAQGVLAAPSVLAALAAAAPTVGGWQPALRGSCCAALAVLAAIHAQSRLAGAFDPTAAAATGAGASEQQQQCPLQLKGSSAGSSAILPGGIAAAILALLASAAAQQQQLWRPAAAAALRRYCVHAAGPVLWAGLAAGSFCGSLHILPGCFSLGEAALLAHGVTALALAAGAAVQHAALFVPHAICQQLPQRAAATLAAAGGCSVAAHQQALSLQRLPTAIVLILAATLAACVLLRLLWLGARSLRAGLRGLSRSGPTAQAQDNKAAAANGHSRAATGAGHKAAAAMRSSSPAATRWQSLACVPVAAAASLLLAAAICVLLLWLCCAAAWTLLAFLPAVPGRVQVLLFWVSLLAVTLPGLRLWCARTNVPQIIVRKVYHLLALGLFVPVFFWDLQLLGLSLAIAFAALVLLEVLRCLRLPLLGRAVQQYMQKFVDERDAGVIYITHFTLLLGLAVPIWLVLAMPDVLVATQAALHEQGCQPPQDAGATAAAPARGVWCEAGSPHCSAPPQLPQQQHGALVSSSSGGSCELGASQLLAGALGIGSAWHSPAAALALVLMGLSGTIIIGVGDTAASLFGQLFGRRPIHAGSKKTVEGTVAGIVLSLGSWLLLLHAVGLLPPLASARGAMWAAQLMAATVGAGLLEAATSQLDNILLPLWYAPHVLLIG